MEDDPFDTRLPSKVSEPLTMRQMMRGVSTNEVMQCAVDPKQCARFHQVFPLTDFSKSKSESRELNLSMKMGSHHVISGPNAKRSHGISQLGGPRLNQDEIVR